MKLFFSGLLLSATIWTQSPTSYVVDEANLFAEREEALMEQKLENLESLHGIEMLVVSVKESPENLTDFAQELFNRWGIGAEQSNEGLLLLVDSKARATRFHTGQGLEGDFPDALSFQWLEESGEAYFRHAEYAQGVIDILKKVESHASFRETAQTQPEYVGPGPFDFYWKSSDGLFSYWNFYDQAWAKGLGLGALVGIFYPILLLLFPCEWANRFKYAPLFIPFIFAGFSLQSPLWVGASFGPLFSFLLIIFYQYPKKSPASQIQYHVGGTSSETSPYKFDFSSFKSSSPKSGGSSFGGGSGSSSNSLGGGKSAGGGSSSRW